MENKQQQILSEIQSMMAAIRNELNVLDAKISEFQRTVAVSDEELAPIELDTVDFLDMGEMKMEVGPVEEVSKIEEVKEEVDDDDLPFFTEEKPAPAPVPELAPAPAPAPAAPAPAPAAPVAPAPAAVTDPSSPVAEAVDKQLWRTATPGSPVKDVRSAISLNDRIQFINKLFGEDPITFQSAITAINGMETLNEVIAYVVTNFPQWNMESDVVYKFMMAVRRRVK